MSDSPRIAELRRRVEADPSSIAFAQLAEEYRRAGNYAAAEQVCRTGLARHPGYLSARVTLGRTLIELGTLDEAKQELQFVLKSAPDNLAAIRGMAEIHQRRGELELALDYYRRALPLARHDPELEETVRRINRDLGEATHAKPPIGLSFDDMKNELLAAAEQMPGAPGATPPADAVVDSDPVAEFASETLAAPVAPAAPAPDAPAAPEHRTAPDAPPAPEAPVALDDDVLIDFDSILKSLGTPDHTVPPIVEALVPEPPAPPAPEPPTAPEHPTAPEYGTAPVAPNAPDAPNAPELPASEQAVLDELEAWLAAMKR